MRAEEEARQRERDAARMKGEVEEAYEMLGSLDNALKAFTGRFGLEVCSDMARACRARVISPLTSDDRSRGPYIYDSYSIYYDLWAVRCSLIRY